MVRDGPKKRRGTRAQFDREFNPVAIEIGHFARAWNGLHEELGVIFATIFDLGSLRLPLAAWHAIPDDGIKRRMLRAAVKAWIILSVQVDAKSKDEILWLLGEVDTLAERRNDALHAPIQVLMDMDEFTFSTEPNYFWGNPRAKKLQGKDLRSEFNGYRTQADRLTVFTLGIQMHLRESAPLPKRPGPPNPDPRHTPTPRARQARPPQPK
jgi:hypothetical protein